METIASFTINHKRLMPGVYVSRKYSTGHDVVTTFDIRMTRPNFEPVMNTSEIHTMNHLGETFLRSDEEWKDKVIYFGPMSCRTGFYLILAGDYESEDIVPMLREMYKYISQYEGDVPGASAEECGNYLDMNLPMARFLADRYLEKVLIGITPDRLNYPK